MTASASSHLMKLLFATRFFRPDFTVAITRLASKVAAWNSSHDKALHRLMSCVQHHAAMKLLGCLSTKDADDAMIFISADADLAGDM